MNDFPEKERIQKVLASSGDYSRRQVERLMDEGKVKVNGVVIRQKGTKVDPLKDRIQVAGKAYRHKDEEKICILFHKPRKTMVTRYDPEDRPTVFDYLPKQLQHLKPVGRLDFNTQGALLLTNDGDLILKLTHPRYHLPKVYEVKITQMPDEKQLKRLRQGIVIDGARTLPAEVGMVARHETSIVLEIKITEGKNRQIHNMLDAVGLSVKELRRVAIGPVELKKLKSGQFRLLTPQELKKLERVLKD